MYLVFAGEDIVRNSELIYGNVIHDEENGEIDYDLASWEDTENDILLGEYEESLGSVDKILEIAAQQAMTDKTYLYAIKVENPKKLYYGGDYDVE